MDQLDPQVLLMAKAIRQVESGGNFNVSGRSGEYGAYQFMPATWAAASKKFLGVDVPLTKATSRQQNEVAYKQLKEWKDKGYNLGQVASMWNAGPGRPDAYLGFKGTNNKGVSYDTGLYARRVAQEYQKLKGLDPSTLPATTTPSSQAVVNTNSSPYGAVGDALGEFSTGVAKGGLSTLKGLGTIGQTFLDQTAGRVVNAIQGKGFTPTTATPGDAGNIYRTGSPEEQAASEFLKPQGAAQNIGYGVEQAAEYFIPASKAAKAERALTNLTSGLNTIPKAAANILGKGAIQGLSAGAVKLAQTGGDLKASGETALFAGGTRAALASVGELARGFKLPERLYSMLFKNSKNDMLQELNANGLAALKARNPEVYNDLVQKGIIKTTLGGKPIVNDTLAEQALARGLKGSIRNMANEVVGKTLETEYNLQKVVGAYKGSVGLSEPQFHKVLKEIAQEYENVGFGEISTKASNLADELITTKGKVPASVALEIRRLLDKARIARSFDVPTSKLSLSQANLKTLADTARSRLNRVPNIAPLMKDYSFYIDALESLAKEAARRENNQIISLIDSVFLGGGLSSGNPVPLVTLGMARKALQSGPGLTYTGQALNKSAASPKLIGGIGALSNGVQTPQESQ